MYRGQVGKPIALRRDRTCEKCGREHVIVYSYRNHDDMCAQCATKEQKAYDALGSKANV